MCEVSHYCLFWKPNYSTKSLENARCFNIISEQFPNCLLDQLKMLETMYFKRNVNIPITKQPNKILFGIMELFAFLTNVRFGVNPHEHGMHVVNLGSSALILKVQSS
ncbi:uncharacterized protein LOC114942497 [Nylanderia fulva]|uniref:uncharacterized protein LOC114942497 n=1 Tax=Nylanderia fulva TaxID=613905 RepID=UPI0010FAE654|nr:uncharacterized protein LOC114942497 [Nylanderia fulva]